MTINPICRIDKKPEQSLIYDSIINGSEDRINEILEFISNLNRIDGNYSIFLDGEWGSGKTFFVKQVSMALLSQLEWYTNENDSVDFEKVSSKLFRENNLEYNPESLCYPIYFNAWEYDYAQDPIEPLVACLINEFDEHDNCSKERKNLSELLSDLASSVSINLFGIFTIDGKGLKESFEKEDLLNEFNKKSNIRSRIKDVFTEASAERCSRFVLFVDELDRCRPEYAIKVLEALKFVFDQDNLTIVFSVNANALGKSISSWYGDGFDGPRYLKRFYDCSIPIGSWDPVLYLSNFDLNISYDSYVAQAINAHEITIRDANRCIDYFKKLQSLDRNCLNSSQSSIAAFKLADESYAFHIFVFAAFVSGLILLFSRIDTSSKKVILEGKDLESVRFWFEEDDAFSQMILNAPSLFFKQNEINVELMSEESISTISSERIVLLYRALFDSEEFIDKTYAHSPACEAIKSERKQVRSFFNLGDSAYR